MADAALASAAAMQQSMARPKGNFKRGNERVSRRQAATSAERRVA